MLGGLAATAAAPLLGRVAVAEADNVGRVPKARPFRPSGRLREYWLQVEPISHNVVPTGFDEMMGMPITVPTTIHALAFRAYTPNWGQLLPGSADLGPNSGFPGPVIRAEVGDRVAIHVRNHDTHYRQPHSLHAHGLRYKPDSDGAWTAADHNPGSRIPVGGSYTYHYDAVPDAFGTWPYHDHSIPFNAGPPSAANASTMHMTRGAMGTMELGAELGLMGHIVVTEPGETQPDREQYLVMHDLYAADIAEIQGDIDCFNGRAFLGNTPTFTARVGEHVRWHVIALGTEFHVFHIHGHRWQTPYGNRTDVAHLGPAMAVQLDYIEDNPGRWLYHCHVVDHMIGGMIGWYEVTT